MAKRERLGGVVSLAGAALLTAGLLCKVVIEAGFDLAKLPGDGRLSKASLEAPGLPASVLSRIVEAEVVWATLSMLSGSDASQRVPYQRHAAADDPAKWAFEAQGCAVPSQGRSDWSCDP